MYIQYRKIEDNKCLYIKSSSITKEDIKNFSLGEYDSEDKNLTEMEILKKYIFTDFLDTDLIVEDSKILSYPIYNVDNNTVIGATREQIILIFKDKSYLKEGEFVDEKGVLQTVPKIEGTRVEWNWETHEWEEKATNLEIVQAQYKDYEGMDTPSTLEEMKQQDPALATEYLNMMIELRGLIYTLSASETQAVGYAILPIPQPSEKLKEFKNKFKLTK